MIVGSIAIIFDPIFQGMAISLLFGAIVATALTLIVIPLACYRAPNAYRGPDGENPFPVAPASESKSDEPASNEAAKEKASSGQRMAPVRSGMSMVYRVLRATPYVGWMAIKGMFGPFAAKLTGRSEATTDTAARQQAAAPLVSDTSSVRKSGSSTVEEIRASVKKELAANPAKQDETPEKSDDVSTKPAEIVPSGKDEPVDDIEPEMVSAPVEALEPKTEKVAAVADVVDEPSAEEIEEIFNPSDVDEAEEVSKSSKAEDAKPEDQPSRPEAHENLVETTNRSAASASNSDDLKRIKGIGAVLEKELNALGINRYEQIANLTVDDLSEARMKSTIMQRAKKDEWLEQAGLLAAGETTEFSDRVDAGKVSSSSNETDDKNKG